MTLYLVRCRRIDSVFYYTEYLGGTLKAFSDRAAAERFRDARDAERRAQHREHNPFEPQFLDGQSTEGQSATPPWEELSTLPPAALCDWLVEGGVEPPPFVFTRDTADDLSDLDAWSDWWGDSVDHWTPEQFDRVWQGFDRFRFHDLVEVPLAEVPGRE